MTPAPRCRLLAVPAIGAVLLSGCGTQLSRSEIIATNGTAATQQLTGSTDPSTPDAGAPAAGEGGTTGRVGEPAAGAPGGSRGVGTTDPASVAGGPRTVRPGSGTGSVAGPVRTSGAPIAIGQVGTFSGVGGGVVGPGQKALAAWVSWTNAHGGVAGRPIKLYSADDGGDQSKSSSLMQGMVQTNKVVAFVGQMIPITFVATFNFAATNKVPVVGGDVSADGWYKTPYVFPQGSYIDDVFYADLRQAVLEGKKKLAMIYCIESAACTYTATAYGENGMAAKAGAQIVYSSQTSVASLSYQSLCQNAKAAGADVVAVSLDGAGISRFARDCAQIGYKPQYITSATAVNDGQASDPNLDGMIISSNVFPWTSSSPAGAAAFQQAMKRYAPTATLAASSAQAWSAGELFKAAVESIGPGTPITSASVAKALQSLGTFSNGGLSPRIRYGPGLPTGGKCVFILRLTRGKWVGQSTTPDVCGP